jgi:hypothetical protein
MVSRYNKPIVISEIGMSYTSPTEAKAFVEDIISKNGSLANNMGLGVFWWEPETYNWRGYDKGAWGTDGKPTIALNGFLTNCNQQYTDCNGDVEGFASVDHCGQCTGGNTGVTPCAPVTVTFEVDMNGQSISNGVYITGTMLNWQITPMISAGKGIYSYNMDLYPGDTGAYYYLNANQWGSRETVPAACAKYWDSDRGFTVPKIDTVLRETWSGCSLLITGSDHSFRNEIFSVYPNPFSSIFTIAAENDLRFEIYNLAGLKIEEGNCRKGICTLGNDLEQGTYLLKVFMDEKVKVIRVVKE